MAAVLAKLASLKSNAADTARNIWARRPTSRYSLAGGAPHSFFRGRSSYSRAAVPLAVAAFLLGLALFNGLNLSDKFAGTPSSDGRSNSENRGNQDGGNNDAQTGNGSRNDTQNGIVQNGTVQNGSDGRTGGSGSGQTPATPGSASQQVTQIDGSDPRSQPVIGGRGGNPGAGTAGQDSTTSSSPIIGGRGGAGDSQASDGSPSLLQPAPSDSGSISK